MARFQLTRTAREDLKAIGRYTQRNWGRRQRDAYLTQLDRRFHALAEMPGLGRACDVIRPGYRRYAEGSQTIFYREVGGGIEIVRILDGRMDPDRHFSPRVPAVPTCRKTHRLLRSMPRRLRSPALAMVQ